MEDKLFLSNHTEEKFIQRLKDDFSKCQSFYLSVSFIKEPGLKMIEPYIIDALKRGAKGRIITTTYKFFTDSIVLKKLKEWHEMYSNFDARVDYGCFGNKGYHSKGYIFQIDDSYEMLIGSTNITKFALLYNVEWNLMLKVKDDEKALADAVKEFTDLWAKTLPITDEIIEEYKERVEFAPERWDMDNVSPDVSNISPNAMQQKALLELNKLRAMGENKALVIASTGSGKTYLAAFDAFNFDAKRLLFIVHRDTVLVDALETFKKVFGKSRTFGLYNGKNKENQTDFLFASNIMVANNLSLFNKDEFDYIIIDECHHAAASTYKKIIDYFDPDFLLGLTATPERMDNEDVYEMFGNNVPYELRLREAIENDLVVPFHYFGIRDNMVDYSDKAKKSFIAATNSEDHIDFIVEQIEKHRLAGEKLKAIAFCRDIEHATTVSAKLSERGYSTCYLTGHNDTSERRKAYSELQREDKPLEIICTIDILNEGVDIPAINMVIFLRPTESQTIFLQQLGRGLRKYTGKKYVTVLDFIGNCYDRSVQIALALGDLSENAYIEKGLLRSLVKNNFEDLKIPGVEITFDKYSQDEILENLEHTNFNEKKFLEKSYASFKKYLKLDTYPKHMDYLESEYSPELMRFTKSKLYKKKKNRSYYNFLRAIEEKDLPFFYDDQIEVINILTDMLPLARKEEYLIVKQIIDGKNTLDQIEEIKELSSRISDASINSALLNLEHKKVILVENGSYKLNYEKESDELREYLKDLIQYGIERYEREFGDFDTKFKLYGNYMLPQIMMEIEGAEKMQVQGTKIVGDTAYLFVGLQKDKRYKDTLNYEDTFLSPDVFQWESVTNTTVNNKSGKSLLAVKTVHLFIRKVGEEDGITMPLTYFGTGHFNKKIKEGIKKSKPTLIFTIDLDNPVPEKLRYDFLVPEAATD